MKKHYCIFVVLVLTINLMVAQNKVTFTVDMSKVKDAKNVGIRGSIEPLSWEKTLPMNGPNANGHYSVTINFKNDKKGKKLSYKYMNKDTIWDNNSFGTFGNRTCILLGVDQKLDVDTWNVLDKLDKDEFYNDVLADHFYGHVYLIHFAKKNNTSIKELAKERSEFWKGPDYDNWKPMPQDMLNWARVNTNKYEGANFKELENKPGLVKYSFTKAWKSFMGKEAKIKDVTVKDIEDFYKASIELFANDKGMTVDWDGNGDEVIVTIKTK